MINRDRVAGEWEDTLSTVRFTSVSTNWVTAGADVTSLKGSAEQCEADTNTMQDRLGSAGNPDASNLMQEAKIYADPCSRRQ